MKAQVGAFNQEKALVGAFSVITNLRMQFGCNFLRYYYLPSLKPKASLQLILYFVQTEMYEKTRDILYPNPAVRVKQVSDKGIASIGVSCYHISSPELDSVRSHPTHHQPNSVVTRL